MNDLYNDILISLEDLDKSVKSVRKTGADYAHAYRDACVELREEILKLEADGRPVTNLKYIARGSERVANAEFEKICKEAIYKANLESINAIKLKIKVLENQLEREWNNIQSD